jgi:hypothetical protein
MDRDDTADALLGRQSETIEFGGTLFGRARQLNAFDGADLCEATPAEDRSVWYGTPPAGL